MLGNRSLLRLVAECMAGLPCLELSFLHQAPTSKYSLESATELAFPKKIGWYPHVAIALNDQRVLETIYHLRTLSVHSQEPAMSFKETIYCAAAFGRLEMLQWLYQRHASDPDLAADATTTTNDHLVVLALSTEI